MNIFFDIVNAIDSPQRALEWAERRKMGLYKWRYVVGGVCAAWVFLFVCCMYLFRELVFSQGLEPYWIVSLLAQGAGASLVGFFVGYIPAYDQWYAREKQYQRFVETQ